MESSVPSVPSGPLPVTRGLNPAAINSKSRWRAALCRLPLPALALAALSALSSPTQAAGAGDKVACPKIDSLDIARLKRSTLVGEMHGTNESPAFVAALACHILTSGRTLTVALEIPRTEQDRVRSYLLSSGSAADRAAMLKGAFWATDKADGRSSAAMVDLIERLRYLRSLQLPLIDVVTIDVAAGEEGAVNDRDRLMSQAFDRVTKTPSDHVVGLVGNYHAKKTDGAPWNPRLRFMAGYLPPGGLTSLDVGYDGGAAWVCMPECGVTDFGASSKTAAQGFSLRLMDKDGGAYDGIYEVGRLSPSLPARSGGG
jgi:hypothetical protein